VGRRTTIQLVLLVIGLVVWGYGQRVDDPSLRLVGIVLFALATMLRFFRRSGTKAEEPADNSDEPTD
jgi:hypothetical protein